MKFPTKAELRSAYASSAEATQSTGDSAAIRAAVAVILPEGPEPGPNASWVDLHRYLQRLRIRSNLLMLADAIERTDG